MRSITLLAMLFCFIVVVTVPSVSAKRYLVGNNMGWTTSGVNYSVWASDKHFHLGDWLYFVHDRHQTNVLEVSKTSYENCISKHPLVNWTAGAGRDVVPLNQTRHYYFISGNGFCYSGMKMAINVLKPPSTSPVKIAGQSSPSPSASPVMNASQSNHSPSASPVKSAPQHSPSPSPSPVMNAPQSSPSPSPLASLPKNAAPSSSYRGSFVLPFAFAIGAIWDSLRRVVW